MPQPLLSVVNEEAPAPYMRVAKAGAEATVRQLILACKGIHPGPKAVLAEICNMHDKGGRECYDANNQHLATKLGITVPMVSRHIRNLAERGLLVVEPRAGHQRRTLTPLPELRLAYRSGKVANITEVVRLAPQSGKVTTSEPYQSGNADLTEVVTLPYRSGKHNRSLIEKEELLLKLADAEKKIADLQSELQSANAACEEKNIRILGLSEELKKASSKKVAPAADPMKGKGRLIEAAYIDWYTQRNELAPKLKPGADHKAAKDIFAYLYSQSKEKSDEGALNGFHYVLANWHQLEPFLQKQIDLCQINSNLNRIIDQLRNHGKPTAATAIEQSARARQLGLVDTSKFAAAAARRKELGLD